MKFIRLDVAGGIYPISYLALYAILPRTAYKYMYICNFNPSVHQVFSNAMASLFCYVQYFIEIKYSFFYCILIVSTNCPQKFKYFWF